MLLTRNRYLSLKKHSITIALAVVVMLLSFFSSCGGKKKEVGDAITERDSMPILDTRGVTTFVSDSGITKYKIITAEWLVFDRKRPSYWAFEKGIYMDKFDTLFNIDATIKADTAYYYDKERLWKLIGNVEIMNLQDEKFYTELLYWDQNLEKIYSDRFIRIEQPGRTIMGDGFEANQSMTEHRIKNIRGPLEFENKEPVFPAGDTFPVDTID